MSLGRDDHVLPGVVQQVAARPITLTSRMQLRQMSITEAPGALVRIWSGEWGAGAVAGVGSVQRHVRALPATEHGRARAGPEARTQARAGRKGGRFAQM